MRVGSALRSIELLRRALPGLTALVASSLPAASVYRYQDESGQWVFTDKRPEQSVEYESTARPAGRADKPAVEVQRIESGDAVSLLAVNDCHCPVEVVVQFQNLRNAVSPDGSRVSALLAPRQSAVVARAVPIEARQAWSVDFEYGYVIGDPRARHLPDRPYRPPFGAARRYRVSQAFPDTATHDTPDSSHAVDIAMPEQSSVHAARGGIVVEVAHSNFRGGADRAAFGAAANIIRILHDDGSFAIYAHLSWDSIRVRPGQRVERGEYIADSGSTGFTTGPHLHFAVLRNDGQRTVSVPILFEHGQTEAIVAQTGVMLGNP